MITYENYEIWFVDYLDGNLSQAQITEVKQFIAANPSLAMELDELIFLNNDIASQQFENKPKLSSIPYEDEFFFETVCIDKIEGNLSAQEESLLLDYCNKHPEKLKTLQLFEKTILLVEPLVAYPNKASLYKKTLLVTLKPYFYAAAASVLLFFGIVGLNNKTTVDQNYVAHIQPVIEKVKTVDPVSTVKKNNTNKDVDSKTVANVNPILSNTTIELVNNGTQNPAQELEQQTLVSTSNKNIAMEPIASIPANFANVDYSIIIFDNSEIIMPLNNELFTQNANVNPLIFDKIFLRNQLDKVGGKLTTSMLNVLSNVSENKFSYTQTSAGDVKSVGYNSDLLSFSIPLK